MAVRRWGQRRDQEAHDPDSQDDEARPAADPSNNGDRNPSSQAADRHGVRQQEAGERRPDARRSVQLDDLARNGGRRCNRAGHENKGDHEDRWPERPPRKRTPQTEAQHRDGKRPPSFPIETRRAAAEGQDKSKGDAERGDEDLAAGKVMLPATDRHQTRRGGHGQPAWRRTRASTITAPSGPTMTGLRSISATSGCASTMALTRRRTSSSAPTLDRGAPR